MTIISSTGGRAAGRGQVKGIHACCFRVVRLEAIAYAPDGESLFGTNQRGELVAHCRRTGLQKKRPKD